MLNLLLVIFKTIAGLFLASMIYVLFDIMQHVEVKGYYIDEKGGMKSY